jgi:hypothetical protein
MKKLCRSKPIEPSLLFERFRLQSEALKKPSLCPNEETRQYRLRVILQIASIARRRRLWYLYDAIHAFILSYKFS